MNISIAEIRELELKLKGETIDVLSILYIIEWFMERTKEEKEL